MTSSYLLRGVGFFLFYLTMCTKCQNLEKTHNTEVLHLSDTVGQQIVGRIYLNDKEHLTLIRKNGRLVKAYVEPTTQAGSVFLSNY